MEKAYRQGELVFVPRTTVIEKASAEKNWGAKKKSDNKIREGELAGHIHEATKGDLLEHYGTMTLAVPEGTEIIHPEHKTLHLPKTGDLSPVGELDIIIQREYSEEKDREVRD